MLIDKKRKVTLTVEGNTGNLRSFKDNDDISVPTSSTKKLIDDVEATAKDYRIDTRHFHRIEVIIHSMTSLMSIWFYDDENGVCFGGWDMYFTPKGKVLQSCFDVGN